PRAFLADKHAEALAAHRNSRIDAAVLGADGAWRQCNRAPAKHHGDGAHVVHHHRRGFGFGLLVRQQRAKTAGLGIDPTFLAFAYALRGGTTSAKSGSRFQPGSTGAAPAAGMNLEAFPCARSGM